MSQWCKKRITKIRKANSFISWLGVFVLIVLGILETILGFPPFLKANVSLPDRPVLAFYYGWYDAHESWLNGREGTTSNAVSYVPSIGFYNSQNFSVIDYQITEAMSAGINGFVSSWLGPGSYTDQSTKMLMQEASSKFPNFAVTFFIESPSILAAFSEIAAKKEALVNDVSYIEQNYSSFSSFARLGGCQVIFFYDTDVLPPSFWQNVTFSIHSMYPNLLLIGDSLNSSYIGSFDGEAPYVNLNFMKMSINLENDTYPFYLSESQLLNAAHKIWFSVASPGFNNTNDPSENYSVVPRNNGSTYTQSWSIAAHSDPQGIIIGTWNEYFEGTSIEPTTAYSSAYLSLTRQLISAWR